MKNNKLSFQAQKITASLLHLVFLSAMFAGIGLMYLNDNFGVGISKIQNTTYEETEEFNSMLNSDLDDIFHYMDYYQIFATDGSIDVSKKMLQVTFGPNETVDYSLGDLISYLQSLGYILNEDFKCTFLEKPESCPKPQTGYINWSASEPDIIRTDFMNNFRRCTLEEISLEIMDTLHKYYSTYNRLIANPSNLHFKIEYREYGKSSNKATIFTNDPNLTPENVKDYGRYAYLPGNSVFYDTNFRSLSLSTISALSAGNPYAANTYYLVLSVDTNYPFEDAYSKRSSLYAQTQHEYIIGFVLMVIGALLSVGTLLFLLFASGHKNKRDKTITLHDIDHISAESGILLFSALTGLALYLCRLTVVRAAHLTLAEDAWYLAEQVLYSAVIYLGFLLLFFSLLRRYKAKTLWTGSLTFRIKQRVSLFFTRQDFTARLSFGFFFYLAINTTLIWLLWFLWKKTYINYYLIRGLIALLLLSFASLNLWIFYLLFRKSAEQDKISFALERLAAGETSYQVTLDDFEGKEWELASNINNISVGLETALQEKVKSERLKADLITNVSHDIKTPLTSIINYVDLIKRENIQNEKIRGYLEVLEQKSHRLKTLTEDLVEASKASSGNLKLEIANIDIVELVCQTNGEFEEKFASRHLDLVTTAPDEAILIEGDGRRLWRVLENLYTNAYKYAMEGSRIYVDIAKTGEGMTADGVFIPSQVVFTIKNVSSNPLNIRPEELTERFVRGDVARTTEGSGLGLSIAKSLTELQRGTFDIIIDGDLFKVRVAFDIKKREESNGLISEEKITQHAD